MKKLILILSVVVFSCNKKTTCECSESIENNSGLVSSKTYYVRTDQSKKKSKQGSCSSYTVSEVTSNDYVVTKRNCFIR